MFLSKKIYRALFGKTDHIVDTSDCSSWSMTSSKTGKKFHFNSAKGIVYELSEKIETLEENTAYLKELITELRQELKESKKVTNKK